MLLGAYPRGAFVLITLVACASAADYYISPSGSDANSGTSPQEPLLTLSMALEESASNDTINAAAGVYKGSGNVGLSISDRTIVGSSEGGCIFQGSNSTMFEISGFVSMSDITLEGAESQVVGLQCTHGRSSVIMTRVTFSYLSVGVSLCASMDTVLLQSSSAVQTVDTVLYFTGSSGVDWGSILVDDCFFSTAQAAIYLSVTDLYGTVESVHVSSTEFVNSGMFYRSATGPELGYIQNCTFTNCTSVPPVELIIAGGFSASDSSFTGNGPSMYAALNIASYGSGYFDSASNSTNGSTVYTTSLAVESSYFADNSGTVGAVLCNKAEVSIVDSVFLRNTGQSYGAVLISLSESVTISESLFFYNTATEEGSQGGAVHTQDAHRLRLDNSVFAFNSAGQGGAAYLHGWSSLVMNVSFVGNEADTGGGLFTSIPGNTRALSFISNVATNGAGMAAYFGDGGYLGIRDSVFDSNVAKLSGGAIDLNFYANSDDILVVRLKNATITGNSAETGGGVLLSGARSRVTVQESELSGNSASQSGGAVYCVATHVSLEDSVISDNQSPDGSAYTCMGSCSLDASTSEVNGTVGGNCGSDADKLFYGADQALFSPLRSVEEAYRLYLEASRSF